MAQVTLVGTPSLGTTLPPDTSKLPPLPAGEDLPAGAPCYIASDGKVYKSTAVAANAAAEVHGWTMEAVLASQRQTVSLHYNVNIPYGSGLTPGAYLYLSSTVAGTLQTTAPTNQTKPIALVMPGGIKIRTGTTW